MSKFLQLAIRNVFRNRRRSLMTLFIVAGGVAGLLLVGGFFSFMFWALRESTIHNGLGHLQVFNSAHFERDEVHALENGLSDYKSVASKIAGTPHVRGVAPRIEFYGMVSNGSKSSIFMGNAIDPVEERRMEFPSRVSAGKEFSSTSTDNNEALLGAGLARSMSVKPGDSLTVLAVTADGALNGIDIDVVGIVTTGFKEMDDRLLKVRLPAAQRLLQTDRVTNLVVGLDDTNNTEAVYQAITSGSALGPGLTVKQWLELAAYYRQVRLMFSGIFLFLGVIVFFMVVMSSANTLLMAMFERTREIGTMLAMGTPRSWLVRLFLLEAGFTGLLGAIAGVVTGSLIGVILNRAGLVLPPPPGNTSGLPLKVIHEPTLMLAASLLVILTLTLASVMPAIRGSRMKIVEALAHV